MEERVPTKPVKKSECPGSQREAKSPVQGFQAIVFTVLLIIMCLNIVKRLEAEGLAQDFCKSLIFVL